MIFDSHAHYDDRAFDSDRDEILSSLKDKNVGRVVDVSADIKGIDKVLALANSYDFIYASVGIHPDEVGELRQQDTDYLTDKARTEKVVAIGEIGLDYFCREGEEKDFDLQKKWFDIQMSISKDVNLPVIIHSRDSCKDTMDILRGYKDIKAVMHCFSYTRETARELLDMGYMFGIGGVVTFKNSKKLKEAVEYIPIEHILLETDCPYLAPVPHRGERNDSGMIKYVIEEIASIKNISPEAVEDICWKNTCDFYGVR